MLLATLCFYLKRVIVILFLFYYFVVVMVRYDRVRRGVG